LFNYQKSAHLGFYFEDFPKIFLFVWEKYSFGKNCFIDVLIKEEGQKK
jgi:hypothetical protein